MTTSLKRPYCLAACVKAGDLGMPPTLPLQPVCASRNVLLVRDISLVEAKSALF